MYIKILQLILLHGGCGQVVKAMDCDSITRGFESRHSPIYQLRTKRKPYCAN